MTRGGSSQHHLEYPEPGAVLAPGWHTLRGWLIPAPERPLADVRARAHGQVFPGIYGFPRADLATHFKAGTPHLLAEFAVRVQIPAGTTEVILEALDLISGTWTIFHTASLTAAPGGLAPGEPHPDSPHQPAVARRFINRLLQLSQDHPDRSLDDLARELRAGLPDPWRLRDTHEPFVGVLDEPVALSPSLYGRFTVLGWLFHRTEVIRRVWATADLQGLHALDYGAEHTTLAGRFPEVPHAVRSEIFGFVDIPLHLRGPACVRVYAELADGSLHLCLVTRSVPVTEAIRKRTFPVLSRRRHSLAVAAAQSSGLILQNPDDWTKEAAAAWNEYARFAPPRATGSRHAPVATTVSPDAGRAGHLTLVSHNLNYEGASLFLLEYARHLAGTGWKLAVVSAQDGPLRADFERLGAAVSCVDARPLAAARTAGEVRDAQRTLAQALPLGGTDLVLANTLACHWAVTAGRAAGKPTLFYLHESAPPPIFFRDGSPALLTSVRQAFAAATRVGFLTPASRKIFDTWSGRENFLPIPGWIDLAAIDAFRAKQDRATLRRELGLADGDRLVVSVGTVCDRKGQHTFVRAADLWARQDPEAAARTPCWMVGGRDTPYNTALAAFLPQLRHPRLRIVAETGDVYRYYAAADLFVCTSFEESLPRVLMEAMAFGLPIVSTDVHGVPDIVRDGAEARLVAPGDAPALAAAMRGLLDDPPAAAALAARARKRVEETFRMETVLPVHAALACALARGPA